MKVNQMNQQQKEKAFQSVLSFKEYLDYFSRVPINKMNKISLKFNPLNNTTYLPPLEGA